MKHIKAFIFAAVVLLLFVTASPVVLAGSAATSPHKEQQLLLVIGDLSQENYGAELTDLVYKQLQGQIPGLVLAESVDAANLEQTDLQALAIQKNVKQILFVEILPTKSDFKDIICYKQLRSQATLKICLYDRDNQKYLMREIVTGTDQNTTWIPYTGVGKKVTVQKAVQNASVIIGDKINQLRLAPKE
ncbi:hypothetical protein [Propionispira raffinosivorans]|uniref:hypothetical protein n=1 Tax=Propionispira raffinosivorans TaxID=86959 RepID=UPI00036DE483|nr:hypothetical protein [Propionispira raffinosivorans]